MTDRDRCSLRGAVKFCELHRVTWSGACGPDACETKERIDGTTAEFRRDGLFIRLHHKDPPPHPESTSFYEYDRNTGQLTVERFDQGGQVTIARRLEYDSTGRLFRVMVPGKNGERVAETYTYDPDGRKHKVVHVELHLPIANCGTFIGVEGTDLGFGTPGVATITCNYDERGRPAEHLCHDSGGELLTRIDLLYDDRGNLIEETCSHLKLPAEITAQCNAEQLETMRGLFTFGRRHRYDDQNRRVETSSIGRSDDRDRATFAYNDHGDVVLEISESSHSEYDVGENGALITKPDSTRTRRWETQSRYQYDAHGNWIEKIVSSADGHVWSTEHRTIQYFEGATP
jgi:hypothetical protein